MLKLWYDGGWKDDTLYGKGKEYYENGKIKYDGEYWNKFLFKGKKYNSNGKLVYEGEWKSIKDRKLIYIR
tara:strand:+ start:179 stop:388 length:210 start_codon:yes stop_codon:yes gene_type:complete